MKTIVVVRHGETALNLPPERIRGWRDLPLDAKGKKEAAQVAREISKVIRKPGRIYTSDLIRASKTADIIRGRWGLGVEVKATKGLRPWDVGKFTGQPVKDILPELTRMLKARGEKIPGGESFNEFVGRAIDAWCDIMAYAEQASNPVIAVTHTRNIRVLLALAADGVDAVINGPPSLYLSKAEDPIPPGDFLVLKFDGKDWKETAEEHNRASSTG